jgi:hypothetical protein
MLHPIRLTAVLAGLVTAAIAALIVVRQGPQPAAR